MKKSTAIKIGTLGAGFASIGVSRLLFSFCYFSKEESMVCALLTVIGIAIIIVATKKYKEIK
ncbi:hypothetical protein ACFQ22_08130 [Lentilactobacillus raoultii]|uniref:Uncharacterized protein n=1 Tax=Lentilactobacillus raoultii TaxID=1987503 RepID=A0ABW3PI72_9LACO|nr:hypothetical protein [Lentilactobacillus raoultii]